MYFEVTHASYIQNDAGSEKRRVVPFLSANKQLIDIDIRTKLKLLQGAIAKM